jgi:hypothetical protein
MNSYKPHQRNDDDDDDDDDLTEKKIFKATIERREGVH